jgi:multicomponent Na+:H+ antiporter subunit A
VIFAVVAVAILGIGNRWGSRVFLIASVGPLAALVWAVSAASRVGNGDLPSESWTWVSSLGLIIDFRADWFSILMALLISVVGIGVFLYAVSYFENSRDVARIASALVMFAGAMFGLVVSDNLLLLFVFWELTSLLSYVLIGSNEEKPGARVAALHALLVTGSGGLAMLAGFILIGESADTYSLSAIVQNPPSGMVVNVAVLLVALGAFTKSAQVPFHGWLPRAMEAPTPVSAYLHSATMVKAGVFLVARFSEPFSDTTPFGPVVVAVGCASMILGGWRALRQHDLKLLLAFGTISQLGLMMVLFGSGKEELAIAGCVLLIAHAAYKSSLFLVVGIIDHQTHTRDIRRLGMLGRKWPFVAGVAVAAAASMAGVPPFLGFLSKELAFYGVLDWSEPSGLIVLCVVAVASAFTVAYSARFVWGAFFSVRSGRAVLDPPVSTPPPSAWFASSPLVLASLGLVLGVLPLLLESLVSGSVKSLGFDVPTIHLALWGGFNAPLALSALVLVAGAWMFVGRRAIERMQARFEGVPSSVGVYDATVRGVLTLSDRVTAITQSGSLRVYLAVLVLTMVALPSIPLVMNGWPGSWPSLMDSPIQAVIGIIMIASAVAAAMFHRRFASVIALSVVGYGMAALFVVQGAPDLALTQVLVETLGTVAFVLVIRHLPEKFVVSKSRGNAAAIAVSVAVAVFVFWFALSARTVSETAVPEAAVATQVELTESERAPAVADRTVSEEYLARSKPEAHGSNVVNVIVVDFRGFDTLGEITVLFVAAIGIVGLIRFGARRSKDRTEVDKEAVDS